MTSRKYCAIFGCNNSFPTNLDIRKTWLKLINRPNWTPKKYSYIQGLTKFPFKGIKSRNKHFVAKYLQTRGAKRILLKTAIPTNFVPVKIKPTRTVSSYVHRDILPEASTFESSLCRSTPPLQQPTPSTSLQSNLTPRKKNLCLNALIITLASLLDEIEKRPGLKDHLNDIAATCCNKTIQALKNRANAVIRGEIYQSTTYCDELKTFALTVHFYGPRSYSYIREKFSFCLPHVNTLRKWYKRVDCAPGFTAESFITIKEVSS
ncbi:hypothetical protein ABMA28_000343 [Loxostege sticticalis]|uniref:THAP-type domain-containing protein n=1 Tax=Loxostege sticticalis TaxID=481309 RepID=A0ABD0TRW6_LOXSC